MSKQITVVAVATAKQGQSAALKSQLLELLAPTRAEEGCIEYVLHDNADDSSSFVFVERWESLELLEKHLASPHLQNFVKVSAQTMEKLDILKLTKSAE